MEGAKDPRQPAREHFEQPAISEKRDRDQHAENIRKDNAADGQAVVGAFDERIENGGAFVGELFLAPQAVAENHQNKTEQDAVGKVAGEMALTNKIEAGDVNEQRRDEADDAADRDDDGGVKQIDSLANTDQDEGRDRANE